MLKTLLGRGLFRLWKRAVGAEWHYVFILGHMRSGSTLLNHLLMSHPSFVGLGERNSIYRAPGDLERLAMHAHFEHRLVAPRKFVIDQINHSRMTPDTALLEADNVSLVFLIREPAQTLNSLFEFLGRHYGMSEEEAYQYYVQRLEGLAAIARAVATPERSLYLTYDDLVRRDHEVRASLTSFFGLDPPLAATYRTFPFTGIRGDPSERIASGVISPPIAREPPDIPRQTMESVDQSWAETSHILQRFCRPAIAAESDS